MERGRSWISWRVFRQARRKRSRLKKASESLVEEAQGVHVDSAEINTIPQISFFTDLQLESDHGHVVEVEVASEVQGKPEVENSVENEEQALVPTEGPVGSCIATLVRRSYRWSD
ncbi:hypothetical protein DVH05_010438 [Phytophthora capsici]|nr:hypothetical protein DVH05_010438 [Phytophthora capsici]